MCFSTTSFLYQASPVDLAFPMPSGEDARLDLEDQHHLAAPESTVLTMQTQTGKALMKTATLNWACSV